MAEVLPYRPHHHRDWASSSTVLQMSYAAQGIYFRLLDIQWDNDFIPAAQANVKQMLRCNEAEWSEFECFFEKCFPESGGERRNPRLKMERDRCAETLAKRRDAGSKGGRPSTSKANAKQMLSKSRDKQKHIQREKKGELLVRENDRIAFLGHDLPFTSDQFVNAWQRWVQHRKEKGSSLTGSTVESQVKKLGAWGEDRSIAAIEHSIDMGWTGLFEPKTQPTEQTGIDAAMARLRK